MMTYWMLLGLCCQIDMTRPASLRDSFYHCILIQIRERYWSRQYSIEKYRIE